jgi:hypothetical protein
MCPATQRATAGLIKVLLELPRDYISTNWGTLGDQPAFNELVAWIEASGPAAALVETNRQPRPARSRRRQQEDEEQQQEEGEQEGESGWR